MGYTTYFTGSFELDKKLKKKDLEFLTKFTNTRRMARNVSAKYGVEGEFFVDGEGYAGQEPDSTVIDYNRPPMTQPSLWCQWKPSADGSVIHWDGGEKFYCYVLWIEYLVDKILAPRGYTLNGEVEWQGEDSDDRGKIIIVNNKVTTKSGQFVWD